jgi:predicted TPR repeat methyltransferase
MNSNNDKQDKTSSASSADEYFDRGLQHHRAGRFEEARADYRYVLQLQPEHADAMHMLGVIAYQTGQYDDALLLISRAGKLMPQNAGIYTNLGNVLQARGQLSEAVAAFRNAINLEPDSAVAHNNLGNALRLQGKTGAAVDSFNRALEIEDGHTDAHVNLAITYQAMGDDDRAARSYEDAVKLDPDNKPAAHMLAAMRGEATDGAPPEHVERLFDEYAARFDHHLVDTLGYSMPGELRREIDRQLGPDAHFPNAIDLGCGTGLTGVAFRDLCDNLAGIDLSPRMIDKARLRGVYDDLHVGDIVSVLEADQGRYNLLICADVFPYIGNVQPLFAAVRSHAQQDALFAFSTEIEAEADYILRPSGRYAHSQSYLLALSVEYGFSVITMRTENLRKQRGKWIPGDLVVLQYQG